MKKIFIITLTLLALTSYAKAAQMGTYNPNLEDGIFDRVKINLFQKNKKVIEILEPNLDEKVKQKEREEADKNEYERYKYLYTPTVRF